MRDILVFAGTMEGRKLSECLAAAKISHTVSVATQYGENVCGENPYRKLHQGRMGQAEIEDFIKSGRFLAIVDATHPYAAAITRNIKAALEKLQHAGMYLPYFRLKRDCMVSGEYRNITYFETNEACEKALEHTKGNILLTTGSKELAKYCICGDVKRRLYVRVLPCQESLALCMEQGIQGKQVIAMQGPFCAELNEAVIRQYQISYLVTKESGAAGGYPEKLEAAQRTGAHVFVIGCPQEEEGCSFSEICLRLAEICKKSILDPKSGISMEIILAGIGMGNKNSLTAEVAQAAAAADILLGAERMIQNMHPRLEKHPYYHAGQILPYFMQLQERNPHGAANGKALKVVVLFSGDSGFYSGCRNLYAAIKEEIRKQRLRACVRILPGISSVAYLAACIGESYEDAAIYSMHGKNRNNLVRGIGHSPKTFILTSGVQDVVWLGKALLWAGMAECEVVTGYQLSYEGQSIISRSPIACSELKEEGLYTCFVKNPYARKRKRTHGIADSQFIRGSVPMTKEEVREVSICKLHLLDGSVVYDIGSGTGSVAVEIASLSDDIAVYAVEQKKEAVSLIQKNKEKFCLQNLTIIEGTAPEILSGLPVPSHAFLGGTGGKLKEILSALQQVNPRMRVVINAVSLETICGMREILAAYPVQNEEVVQIQADRVKKAGNYHLLQSENPVWICAFDFAG